MSSPDVINTGILMGIIYVLTGPDHLSALATLCGTNISPPSTSNKKRISTSDNSFLLGLQWGIGHSIGISLFGMILIATSDPRTSEWITLDPYMTTIAEGLVGLCMLILGAYGLFKADKNHRERRRLHHHGSSAHRQQQRRGSRSLFGGGGGDNSSVVSGMSGINFGGGPDDGVYYSDDSDDIASKMEDVLDTDSRCSFHDLHDDNMSACLSVEDYFKDIMAPDDDEDDEEYGTPQASSSPKKKDSRKRRATVSSLVTVKSFFKKDPEEGTRRQSTGQQQDTTTSNANRLLPSRRMSTTSATGAPLSASMLMKKHTEENTIISGSTNASLIDKYIHIFGDHIMARSKMFTSTSTPGLLALLSGFVQGVAGSTSVLGVIPAVQLRDLNLAAMYLATFCVTSSVVMGGFAAFYGTLCKWLAGIIGGGGSGKNNINRVFMVEVGSALLSLCAGCIWVILVFLGKLEEVFP